MQRYYVYILANGSNLFYVGITSDIQKRQFQHKTGYFKGFTSKYNVNRLLHFEVFDDVNKASEREKQLKGWSHNKKLKLIQRKNPFLIEKEFLL